MKILLGITFFALAGFNAVMQYASNEIAIGIFLAVAGGAGLACVPLMNELIIETTYPAGAATSTGIALTSSRIFGAIVIALSTTVPFGDEIEYPKSDCRDGELQDLSWYFFIINSILILYYFVFVFFYRQVDSLKNYRPV